MGVTRRGQIAHLIWRESQQDVPGDCWTRSGIRENDRTLGGANKEDVAVY